MSLPPALLARLAQRGLVQKQKAAEQQQSVAAENEEVIAEDYDEMESSDDKNAEEEYQSPPQYDYDDGLTRKRTDDNFWADRMRARMGDASSYAGYKGCPNKYNIWHKCTLFCVNRWADGIKEPTREYMRRYRRLLRKYPLPKGWVELYDPGCAAYYFYSAADNLVSWLPPTHPKSQLTKSAATLRRKLEETGDPDGPAADDSDYNTDEEELGESADMRHQQEIEDIISSSMRSRSPNTTSSGAGGGGGGALAPNDFPPLHEASQALRKPKNRDLERTLSRQKRDRYERSSNQRRRGPRADDALDPMDPSAYSDIPRGKWSDGLQTESERKKSNESTKKGNESKGRRDAASDDDAEDDDDDNEEDDGRNYE